MIKLLIVDDHHLVRTGLRNIIDDAGGIEVVGEAGSGDGARGSRYRARGLRPIHPKRSPPSVQGLLSLPRQAPASREKKEDRKQGGFVLRTRSLRCAALPSVRHGPAHHLRRPRRRAPLGVSLLEVRRPYHQPVSLSTRGFDRSLLVFFFFRRAAAGSDSFHFLHFFFRPSV